jgi:hypothetical protein
MCKLADIYDAMTSRRCYKEAFNQVSVVTDIFRKYASKDALLQQVLFCFVKSIGIYPPGSVLFLQNGQMAYVLDSSGPLLIPFTDSQGNPLKTKADVIDLSVPDIPEELKPDSRRKITMPLEVVSRLPDYLKPRQPVPKPLSGNGAP